MMEFKKKKVSVFSAVNKQPLHEIRKTKLLDSENRTK